MAMKDGSKYRVRARSLTSMPEGDPGDSWNAVSAVVEMESFGPPEGKKARDSRWATWASCLPCWTEDDKDLASWRLSDAERAKARECLAEARRTSKDGYHRPSMCFIRQDILTGKWAHFQLGTGNEKKPRQTESKSKQVPMRPIHEEPEQLDGCPFCASHVPEAADVLRFEKIPNGEGESQGTETMLMANFWKYDAYETLMVAGHQLKNDWSRPNGRPWQVRVVRNIYPSMSVPREYYDDGCDTGFLDDRAGNMINPGVGHPLYLQVPGVGFNDVVIETPLHNMCAALEQEECIALALRAIVIRGQQLLSNPLVGYVTVFKQHKCGSIVHAHWQIITTPFVPSSVDVQLIRAARLKQRFGLCVGCQVLVSAPTGTDLASERLVLETEHFVVSAPFACRERWRLYLAPKRHSPDFFQILPLELEDLAHVLKRVLQMYYFKLDDCPFNIAVWTRPSCETQRSSWFHKFRLCGGSESYNYFHWYIGFYPRGKAVPQGFKNATDIAPMKNLPEDDAMIMRQWLAELEMAGDSPST